MPEWFALRVFKCFHGKWTKWPTVVPFWNASLWHALDHIGKLLFLLLLLMIWQSPGLPGWRKVNFITVTRRPHHPNIAAGLCCLATSPGFLPTLCEKWSGFFYVHRVFPSYTRDRRLRVSSERLGNEDKAPCPRALLPGRGSNRGPPVWKSEALTARPRQLLVHHGLLPDWLGMGTVRFWKVQAPLWCGMVWVRHTLGECLNAPIEMVQVAGFRKISGLI